MRMKYFIFALCFFVVTNQVEAYLPVVITPKSVNDITTIQDPTMLYAVYSTLTGFPHTFEIRAADAFPLTVKLFVPDTPTSQNIISGVIIHEVGDRGRVKDISRMPHTRASWESFFDSETGDSYRMGGSFDGEVEKGVYRIEVSTPDNRSPYMLIIGSEASTEHVGYFEKVRRIVELKKFFGKTPLHAVQSPLVYIPLGLLFIGGVVWGIVRRRRQRT